MLSTKDCNICRNVKTNHSSGRCSTCRLKYDDKEDVGFRKTPLTAVLVFCNRCGVHYSSGYCEAHGEAFLEKPAYLIQKG